MTDTTDTLTEALAWEVANASSSAALVAVQREAHALPPGARALLDALLWQAHCRQINAAMVAQMNALAQQGRRIAQEINAALARLPPLPSLPPLPRWWLERKGFRPE